MAEVDFDPQVLTELDVTLGGDDYSDSFSNCKLSSNQTVNTWKGGKSNYNKLSRPAFSITATVGQDYAAATSLVNYLWSHAGEVVPMTFRANGGALCTADVLLPVPDYGGDVDALLSAALTFGVQGTPFLTPAAG